MKKFTPFRAKKRISKHKKNTPFRAKSGTPSTAKNSRRYSEICNLAFEDSEVEAQVKGKIDSIYAPKSGHISCDEVGEIIDGEQCHILVSTKNSESL